MFITQSILSCTTPMISQEIVSYFWCYQTFLTFREYMSVSHGVGATNPGSVAQLCIGTRSRLKHQLKTEVEEPRDLNNQHAAQRDRDQAKGTGYRQEKGLPCWAGEPGKGRGHHPKQATKIPWQSLLGLTGAEPPRQPLKHDPCHQSVRCQAAR